MPPPMPRGEYGPAGPLPMPEGGGRNPKARNGLANLLLAWYYSGYYTGRYQAMRELRGDVGQEAEHGKGQQWDQTTTTTTGDDF